MIPFYLMKVHDNRQIPLLTAWLECTAFKSFKRKSVLYNKMWLKLYYKSRFLCINIHYQKSTRNRSAHFNYKYNDFSFFVWFFLFYFEFCFHNAVCCRIIKITFEIPTFPYRCPTFSCMVELKNEQNLVSLCKTRSDCSVWLFSIFHFFVGFFTVLFWI